MYKNTFIQNYKTKLLKGLNGEKIYKRLNGTREMQIKTIISTMENSIEIPQKPKLELACVCVSCSVVSESLRPHGL